MEERDAQAERLAAHGVHVGQLDEIVVRYVGVFVTSRLKDLCAKLFLCFRVLREKMEDA